MATMILMVVLNHDHCNTDHHQFGHGLVTTVVGPTQPYLAQKTGVDIGTINLVWTFGFFGYMVTTFFNISSIIIINVTMPRISVSRLCQPLVGSNF